MALQNEFSLSHEQVINGTRLAEYVSNRCGLRVLIAEVERPLLDSVFLLRTEASDDSGCPHALEHLVFFGSDKYPYKGVLDAVANRCLAEGTNAWTATDHTAYTLTTAGYTGFMNLFEVYLDHIMHPILSDEAYLTEVHAVTSEGASEGVLYSEMEDHEYRCDSMVDRAVKGVLYPKNCGYRFETGGRLDDIRKMSNDVVRAYHRQFYRWDNLAIILVGRLPIDTFLTKLTAYLRSENAQAASSALPWTRTVPVPSNIGRTHLNVEFPTSECGDDLCEVTLGWRGPAWKDFLERSVLDILGDYLTSTASSPLEKAFVHVPYPLCSEVAFDEEPFKETMYRFRFLDVPKKRVGKIRPLFLRTLEAVYKEGIDLQRIRSTVARLLAVFEQRLEENPEDGFTQPFVEYVVNSSRPDPTILTQLWAVEATFQEYLMKQSQDFWNQKLKQYFIDLVSIEVRGIPSSALSKALEKKKTQRMKAHREALRRTGLEAHAQRLEKAKKHHNVPIPLPLIESIPQSHITDVKTFSFPSYKNFASSSSLADYQPPSTAIKQSSASCASDVQSFLDSLPYAVYFCDTPSQFVEARLIVRLQADELGALASAGTHVPTSLDSPLTDDEIALLPLFCELLFQCGATTEYMKKAYRTQHGNPLAHSSVSPEILDHQTFSDVLLAHVVDHKAFLGVLEEPTSSTVFPELFTVYLSARKNKLTELGELLLTVLFGAVLTEDRVASLSKALLSGLLRRRRRAKTLVKALHLSLRYDRDNVRCLTGMPYQQVLLRRVADNPSLYVTKLQHLHRKVFNFSSSLSAESPSISKCSPFVLHLVGSRDTLLGNSEFHEVLHKLASSNPLAVSNQHTLREILSLPSSRVQRRQRDSAIPFGNAILMESSTTEGDCLTLSCPGAKSEPHPDAANLLTLCELFSSCDGPLFNAVRNSGSAYGASLVHSLSSGELFLHLSSCTDVVTAFTVSIQLLNDSLQNPMKVVEPLTASSKCTVIFQLIRAEATPADYALERLFNFCLGVPEYYSDYMIQQVDKVTPTSLAATVKRYLPPMISLSVCNDSYADENALVIVTGADRLDEVESRLCNANEKLQLKWRSSNTDAKGALQRVTWDSLVAWIVTGDPSSVDIIKLTKSQAHRLCDVDQSSDWTSSDDEDQSSQDGHQRTRGSKKR